MVEKIKYEGRKPSKGVCHPASSNPMPRPFLSPPFLALHPLSMPPILGAPIIPARRQRHVFFGERSDGAFGSLSSTSSQSVSLFPMRAHLFTFSLLTSPHLGRLFVYPSQSRPGSMATSIGVGEKRPRVVVSWGGAGKASVRNRQLLYRASDAWTPARRLRPRSPLPSCAPFSGPAAWRCALAIVARSLCPRAMPPTAVCVERAREVLPGWLAAPARGDRLLTLGMDAGQQAHRTFGARAHTHTHAHTLWHRRPTPQAGECACLHHHVQRASPKFWWTSRWTSRWWWWWV